MALLSSPPLNDREDLNRLRDLAAEKPTTKMGQIRRAWPEIKTALQAGHTLRLVHKRLNEAGIDIGYRTLSMYIARVRGENHGPLMPQQAATPEEKKHRKVADLTEPAQGNKDRQDPFANIRREREKKKGAGFEYDPVSINKNLMD